MVAGSFVIWLRSSEGGLAFWAGAASRCAMVVGLGLCCVGLDLHNILV
jgi:hypothetical protein